MSSGLPWQAGLVLGVAAYVAVRYGLRWFIQMLEGPQAPAALGNLPDSTYAPVAWLLLAACWLVALISYLDARRRRQLLVSPSGLSAYAHLDWREFNSRVRDAFVRDGYVVEDAGLDSGADFILRKHEQTELVLCRHWRSRLVDAHLVREMFGLMVHHRAQAVKILALGDYTHEARQFVKGKPIQLIHASALSLLLEQGPRSYP